MAQGKEPAIFACLQDVLGLSNGFSPIAGIPQEASVIHTQPLGDCFPELLDFLPSTSIFFSLFLVTESFSHFFTGYLDHL